ncbi:sporulation protein [Nonomuraea fuscirosea]|uniref:sporulation protein n=1 Tax=Nonomuraea fuscirosea TaxID=1291556 RepID=UPI0011B24B84|nr:sporulation protein [Nonomuraea fuscirosea]
MRQIAQEEGVTLSCTHVDVKRWLDGVRPRPATARFIAEALSRKAGVTFTLDDIGFAGVVTPETLERTLAHGGGISDVGSRLLGLTRRDLADDPVALQSVVVPDAWNESLIAWLLSRPEPMPVREYARPSVGPWDVETIRATTQLFANMGFQFGGGHARSALVQYYNRKVVPLLDGKFGESVGRALFAAAAEITELVAWTAYDLGRHGLAQRYFLQGLRLAQVSGDRMLGGLILADMSHQANYLGRYDQAIQLARAAQEGCRNASTATPMALFYAMEARAHAGNGDETASARALLEADKWFAKRNVNDDPSWVGYFDAAEMASEGAHCYRDLRKPSQAMEFVGQAVGLCDPMYVRTLAFDRLVQAASYVHMGEPSQAATVALEAIDLAGPLKSERYLRYIRDLQANLDAYAGDGQVVQFNAVVARKYSQESD